MTSEGLGEMFEAGSSDTCAGKFPLMLMGGRAEGLKCADPKARTTTGVSGIFLLSFFCLLPFPSAASTKSLVDWSESVTN